MFFLKLITLFLVTDLLYGLLEPTSNEYTHSAELMEDEQFHVFWKYDDQDITFEIHCRTLGWVGFGLSPNGGMSSSDIIIGWVKNGQGYLKVTYIARP